MNKAHEDYMNYMKKQQEWMQKHQKFWDPHPLCYTYLLDDEDNSQGKVEQLYLITDDKSF